MKSREKGLKRIFKAFVYSLSGFTVAFKDEAAFRQDLFVFAVGTVAACALDLSLIERVSLISALILILLAELINTAIEAVIDRISDEPHALSKKAKDIGSLLVLVSFINAILWWGAVLWLRFI